MQKRVVIAGSRNFNDYELFSSVVDKCLSRIRHEYDIIILSGHCSGADMMAERYEMFDKVCEKVLEAITDGLIDTWHSSCVIRGKRSKTRK